MKKILFFILLIVSIQSFAQPTGFQKRIVNERIQGGFMVDSLMIMPRFTDTTEANLHKRFDTCGAYFFSYTKDSVYYRACNPKRWVSVGSSSAGGSGSNSQRVQTHTSGATLTVSANSNTVRVDPSTAIDTLTITLPDLSNQNSLDSLVVNIFFGGVISPRNEVVGYLIMDTTGGNLLYQE